MDSPRPPPVAPVTEKQPRRSEVEGEGLATAPPVPAPAPGRIEGEEDMPPLEDEEDGSNAETRGTQIISSTCPANTSISAGDIFLLLDLPANSTVGCDAKAIGTGSARSRSDGGGVAGGFQGIRDIPPGTHFIWVSESNAMSRCGYWFVTEPKEKGLKVRVKQWDKFNEVLVDPASQFEVRDLRENMASLYPQLVSYGFEDAARARAASVGQPTTSKSSTLLDTAAGTKLGEAEIWERLTSCITEKVLSRVTGKTMPSGSEWLFDTSDTAAGENGGVIGPTAASYQKTGTATTSNAHKAVYQNLVGSTGELNFVFPEGDIDLHEYSGITKQQYDQQEGVTPSSPTPDTSLDILRLVDTPGTGITGEDLVGELQLTFLTGLHISNLSCVDQWWHLVLKVFLRAHDLLVRRPSLSLLFLRTLYAQVIYNEEYVAGPSSSSPNNTRAEEEEPEEGIVDVRHEYGGGGGGAHGSNTTATSLLDIVPGNKKKLRTALTLYKRRMNEILLDFAPGDAQRGAITPEQSQVGQVFAEMEAWFWRLGWDLRTDYVNSSSSSKEGKMAKKDPENKEEDDEEGYDYDDDDEYKPVIVDLDENGREVGMVSFH